MSIMIVSCTTFYECCWYALTSRFPPVPGCSAILAISTAITNSRFKYVAFFQLTKQRFNNLFHDMAANKQNVTPSSYRETLDGWLLTRCDMTRNYVLLGTKILTPSICQIGQTM